MTGAQLSTCTLLVHSAAGEEACSGAEQACIWPVTQAVAMGEMLEGVVVV